MDSNYIIKVFDKDDVFKKTLSRKDIDGDIKFSSILNSGFSDMSLKVQNKREVWDSVEMNYVSTLGIVHGDIIRVIDPNQNIVTETTYERLLNASYDGAITGGVTIVSDTIQFDGATGYVSRQGITGINSQTTQTHICRIKINSLTSVQVIGNYFSGGAVRFVSRIDTGGTIFIQLPGDVNGRRFFGTTVLTVGVYYTIGIRINASYDGNIATGSDVTVFIDGIEETLTSSSISGSTGLYSNFIIGSYDTNGPYLDGNISFFHTYSSVLTDREMMLATQSIDANPIKAETLVWCMSGIKYTGTAASPTSILNAMPDNTKQTITDTPIYTGQVIEINNTIAPSTEYHEIDIIGIQAIANNTLYTYSSSYSFTRTAHPDVILKEIIDLIDYLSYTGTSIEAYGSNVSIEFDNMTCLDAIKEIQTATGRLISYDANGIVYFYEQETSPTVNHSFDFRGEISGVYDITRSHEIVNRLVLHHKNAGSGHDHVFEDTTSQGIYGIKEKYIEKLELDGEDTAAAYADAYLAKYAYPLQELKVIVNNKYDIATVKVGDTVKIYGYYNANKTYYIYKLDFTPSQVVLYLNEQTSIEKTLKSLITN